MVGDLVRQHQGAKDVPHADGRPARHHKDHVPTLEQVLADPPVLIALDFNAPVVEEVGHDSAPRVAQGGAARAVAQEGQAQDDQGAAFHHQRLFALVVRILAEQAFQPFAAHVPEALAHLLDRDQAVRAAAAVFFPGVFHVHPGEQGAGGPQNNGVLVGGGQFCQQAAHFGHNVQAGEVQVAVPAKAHARAFADECNLLAVGKDHDVRAGQHAAGRVDGPLHQGDARQSLDQLIGDDGVLFDGRNDDAAFFHGEPVGLTGGQGRKPRAAPADLFQRSAARTSRLAASM